MVIPFEFVCLQLLCCPLKNSCCVPQHSNRPCNDCHDLACSFHEVLSLESAGGVSYIPSWAVVSFLRPLFYLNLESWGICTHLFPLLLLFSCWVAQVLQIQLPYLSSKLIPRIFEDSMLMFLLIVHTVFTRDSTLLSLFANSFK